MRTKTSGIGERPRPPGKGRGFTLIELIVVVAVIVVATGLIVPRMGGSVGRRELDEAAARFVQTARTVRELAVSRRQTCALGIDLDAGGYGVSIASDRPGGGAMVAARASWLKAQRWPESIRVVEYRTPEGLVTAHGRQQLMFMPDGTSSGASLRLAASEGERVIVVHPHNGRAIVGAPEAIQMNQDSYDLGD